MSYASEQSAATNSFFLGLCFAYSVVILTNHRLYALRNNPTVYYSIISGSIAVVLYEIVGTLHETGYANSPVVLALIFLSVLPQHYGIYAIMNQRLLPVLLPTATPNTRLIYDIGVRCLLGLPTTVAAIIALANLESILNVLNIIMPFDNPQKPPRRYFIRIHLQIQTRMGSHAVWNGVNFLVTFDNYMAITKDVTKDILVKPVQHAGTQKSQNKGLSLTRKELA
ncbi:hypothetical protein BKA69DRAFT_378544 [Paraphysoderma sedebokerense]|nr:hypothetical protein BKA69DRAFT_378544 [Paraphysoderma sedebokerense]